MQYDQGENTGLFQSQFSLIVHALYIFMIKEARNSFFGLGVYLLKSNFRIEYKHRFPWYYITFSTYDQSIFFFGSLATAVTIATVMNSPSF